MLVLTRKYQEKIRIGENITITVLRTKGKAVRLGIEAPGDVPVIRGELAFESDEFVGATTEDSREELASAGPVAKRSLARGTAAGAVNSAAAWVSDSPQRNDQSGAARNVSHVGLHRVPRDKVAAALPHIVQGNAPLRAMMNGR
jgi:carbon storage regulator CsrA